MNINIVQRKQQVLIKSINQPAARVMDAHTSGALFIHNELHAVFSSYWTGGTRV